MSLIPEIEIQKKLSKMTGWSFIENQISKNFIMKDFKEALTLVNTVGSIAEEMDHHPDILMHGWNKVKISISTHSEGGITLKDFSLADKIEQLISKKN